MRPNHRRRCSGRNRPHCVRNRPCLQSHAVQGRCSAQRSIHRLCSTPSSIHNHPCHARKRPSCVDSEPTCSWVKPDLRSDSCHRQSKCSIRSFSPCELQYNEDDDLCASQFDCEQEEYEVIDCNTQTFQENVRRVNDDCMDFEIEAESTPVSCSFHRPSFIPCSSKQSRRSCGNLRTRYVCASRSNHASQSDIDLGKSFGMITSTPCVQDKGTTPDCGDMVDETIQAWVPYVEAKINMIPCKLKPVQSAPIAPCEKISCDIGGDTSTMNVDTSCNIKCPRKSVSFGSPCRSNSEPCLGSERSTMRIKSKVSSTMITKCKCSVAGQNNLNDLLKDGTICECSNKTEKNLPTKSCPIKNQGEIRICKCILDSKSKSSDDENGLCSKRSSVQSKGEVICECKQAPVTGMDSVNSQEDPTKTDNEDKKKKHKVICQCRKDTDTSKINMVQSNGDVYDRTPQPESVGSSNSNFTDNSSLKKPSTTVSCKCPSGAMSPGDGMSWKNSTGAEIKQKYGFVNCSCPYNANAVNAQDNEVCTCHYPPAFGHMTCTGNISGNCNCGNCE